MSSTIIVILIGIGLVAVLAVVAAFLRKGKEPESGKFSAGYQMLTLGIVFLIPGLFALIRDGESTSFLSLGIIFTLSGLVTRFLIKPADISEQRTRVTLGVVVGFLVGGALGAAASMVFDLPSVPLILLGIVLGSLPGLGIGILNKRQGKV